MRNFESRQRFTTWDRVLFFSGPEFSVEWTSLGTADWIFGFACFDGSANDSCRRHEKDLPREDKTCHFAKTQNPLVRSWEGGLKILATLSSTDWEAAAVVPYFGQLVFTSMGKGILNLGKPCFLLAIKKAKSYSASAWFRRPVHDRFCCIQNLCNQLLLILLVRAFVVGRRSQKFPEEKSRSSSSSVSETTFVSNC